MVLPFQRKCLGNDGPLGRNQQAVTFRRVDQNQSITRQFQWTDETRNHECTIFWTDENGRTDVYGTLKFTRNDPAPAEKPGKDPKDPKAVDKPKWPPPVPAGRNEDLRRRSGKMGDRNHGDQRRENDQGCP